MKIKNIEFKKSPLKLICDCGDGGHEAVKKPKKKEENPIYICKNCNNEYILRPEIKNWEEE